MSDALLSVCLITYNHAKYIREAINSILIQKVNFSWELIIADDYSTDGTREIVLEYKERYPELIILILQEKNVGAAQNFMDLISASSSKYMAYLEGDDYWTDPCKLQKQVDFLDAHPDFSIVFTRTEVFSEDGERPGYEIPPPDIESYSLENLLKVNFIAACSVMYRQRPIKEFPTWLYHMDMQDWPLHILYAQHGNIGFLDEKMAKYRIHAKSNFSSRKILQNYLSMIKFYRIINSHLNFNYSKSIYLFQGEIYRAIARLSKNEGDWLNYVQYLALALGYRVLAGITR
jgi:glycosyltransferase involved in cell wall biosynthesis